MPASNKSVRSKLNPSRKSVVAIARNHLISEIDDLITAFGNAHSTSRKKKQRALDNSLTNSYNHIKYTAQALKQWYESAKFVDGCGAPRPLTKPELIELANGVSLTQAECDTIVSTLMQSRITKRRNNTYIPLGRSVLIELENQYSLAYTVVAISRLITTIRKNIESDSAKQFERQVSDVKIRAKDFPVFLKFAKDQGEAFIDSIDDWLAEREVSHEQTDAVKVGVGAFAFSDELKLGNIKLRNQSK